MEGTADGPPNEGALDERRVLVRAAAVEREHVIAQAHQDNRVAANPGGSNLLLGYLR